MRNLPRRDDAVGNVCSSVRRRYPEQLRRPSTAHFHGLVSESPTTAGQRRREVAGERSPSEKRATLSRELSELLVELSIGVHRYAMYPPNHPSLGPVVDNVIGRLAEVFESGRESLSIGVAKTQLVIEGVATDPKHPVLADLAKRLHEHQLVAVSFARGTQGREVEGLLETLARDTERDTEPIGLLPPDELPTWPHVEVRPVGYDRLAMGEGPDRATELWLDLARAALALEEDVDEDDAPEGEDLARAISAHGRDEDYDEVIVGYLRQLAGELRDETGETAKIRRRVSGLIEQLDDETLFRLVDMARSRDQKKRFLLDANHTLSVEAVMKVLTAAARSEGESISTSLSRLLTKLATHAGGNPGRLGSQADTALRENVEALIEDWELSDPNPDQYTTVLDAMAGATPLFQRDRDATAEIAGPERVLQMALEVDAWGTTVERAVKDMLEVHLSGRLLELVEAADEGSVVADRVRQYLARPEPLLRLLGGEDVDEQGLHRLVDRMGGAAVDPLLEVLAESDSRSIRRKVFDALARLGPGVAESAVARLDDPRWFVVRNMLALLERTEELPEGFDPVEYTRHPDARVRREAFTLALQTGGSRARTLARALGEKDERLVRMALAELQEGVPETLVPTVVNRVVKSEHGSEVRALAVRLLGGIRSNLVRDALLDLVRRGTSFFGKVRIAEKAPEVLAALRVLAGTWSGDEAVDRVLEVARGSKDPEIRAAAQGGKP